MFHGGRGIAVKCDGLNVICRGAARVEVPTLYFSFDRGATRSSMPSTKSGLIMDRAESIEALRHALKNELADFEARAEEYAAKAQRVRLELEGFERWASGPARPSTSTSIVVADSGKKLAEAIRETVMAQEDGFTFTKVDLIGELEDRYPALKFSPKSLWKTLKDLLDDGIITVARIGGGSESALYRREPIKNA
jgi:hypothetical protein